MKTLALLPLLVLAGCAPPPPAPGLAVIVVSSSSFHGSASTQIFADGTRIEDVDRAEDGPPSHSVTQGSPGVYTKAAAVLARAGLTAKAAMKPHPDLCLDYGTDLVRAVPPIAGFDLVRTQCPDAAVSELMAEVLAALTQP